LDFLHTGLTNLIKEAAAAAAAALAAVNPLGRQIIDLKASA
jgi:hypothetical protein